MKHLKHDAFVHSLPTAIYVPLKTCIFLKKIMSGDALHSVLIFDGVLEISH